ncbi:MAG: hypothetical protein R2851_24655 [Caldilineaceae bacterium]
MVRAEPDQDHAVVAVCWRTDWPMLTMLMLAASVARASPTWVLCSR